MNPPPGHDSFRSWLAVFGASLALFCTVGFLNAFGVFQEYYRTYLPGKSDSDVSWIGSTCIFILYIGAPIAGLLVDKLGPTILLCVGSIGQLLALFMASLCTQYYQLFLAQSLLLGISMSLVFCPPLAVVSRRLPHRRGLALGLTIGGSSIGGVIWPIMLEQLLNHHNLGFAWTVRVIAFTMIPLLAAACFTVVDTPEQKQPLDSPGSVSDNSEQDRSEGVVDSEKPGKTADFSILRNWTFILLCLGLAIGYLGLFAPLFYVSAYAIQQGMSSSTAFYLLSAVNAASFFGRVVPGHLADRYGHFNLCTLSTLMAGITGFCWTAASSLGGLVVWSMAYGFASGGVMSLQGACAGKIAPQRNQGMAVGFLTGSMAVTALVGTPISGQILEHSGYLALSMWTGATLVVGAVILGVARLRLDRNILAAH